MKRKLMVFTFLFFLLLSFYTAKVSDNYVIDKNLKQYIMTINKNYVTIDEIPKSLQDTLLLVEDKKFYCHRGYDVKAIARAFVVNFKAGEIKEGGSTITQQLVKNLFLSSEQTATRKIKEIILAVKLESTYSKEEIMEMYLNVIYYGNGAYGIQNASNLYFNKNVWSLSKEEIAMLVGIPQAPNLYNPKSNPEKARKRQKQILTIMEENKIIRDF